MAYFFCICPNGPKFKSCESRLTISISQNYLESKSQPIWDGARFLARPWKIFSTNIVSILIHNVLVLKIVEFKFKGAFTNYVCILLTTYPPLSANVICESSLTPFFLTSAARNATKQPFKAWLSPESTLSSLRRSDASCKLCLDI